MSTLSTVPSTGADPVSAAGAGVGRASVTAALVADGYLVLPAFAEPHAHL
ncbi:MAG: hypothetical protein JWM12_3759, partial [Ilumatobacteraceae bacterium]|nr:hypothetical protein [Ilumatobacteraceae bacterium]